ncbi:flavin-containing monooxygenase [Aspergillus novofumigatus IBT 16806]|uniref:Putative flavin-binding monooxygenase n=1 Tax=Aspergillus novofumigatus (strain IBT 16806) TaxID=1392255 RepID=A0A2I1BXX9_ASPN1|nr:putative flavin-binding monooxygenase [Aspergillus novofumigatus IBT 16806]PKX90228.1 putative flavin-binding monooxygenase [Aspergillus novofumigatus IBT 16806]
MDYDIIIVGAGISGINAAYRIQSQLPNHRYAILEARNAIGGTWDLFKYPGIRSDSDLFTFGFSWNPWNQDNPIAEGASISKYMRDTAAQYGIDKHIHFQHRLLAADWSSTDNVWKLAVDHEGEPKTYTARFVIFGTGYYNYHEPLAADVPGLSQFQGQVIHPQFWPEDLDYTDKKVVIIGSGATAVTLLPKMAEKAAKVTMLQRSPTYILSLPNRQSSLLSWILPNTVNRKLQRLRWIFTSRLFFLFCQTFPWMARLLLKLSVVRQLPKNMPYNPHFKPRYNPWDQRLCICPDGDFFKSLHTGHADVKTDTIRQVTANSVELNSGDVLDADIIVTATGLKLQIAGGTSITVDGEKQRVSDKYLWNGVMLQDLPNASFVIGYTNASWTLGADATALFVCRLLKWMERHHKVAATPRLNPVLARQMQPRRLLNLNSTYVTAAEKDLPKAADQGPWQPRDNYLSDLMFAKYGRLDEGLEWVDGEWKKQQ